MELTTQLFFPGSMTNLERMVASRAIGSSFVSTLSNEAAIDRVLFEITTFHTGNNIWIFSIAAICLYGHYKYIQGTNQKLGNIYIYDKYSKHIRECIVLVILVLTRDVQNAI